MKKKPFQIMLTPETHLRLKVQAAMLALTLGDFINYMLERQFPLPSLETDLDFARGVRLQEEEENGKPERENP